MRVEIGDSCVDGNRKSLERVTVALPKICQRFASAMIASNRIFSIKRPMQRPLLCMSEGRAKTGFYGAVWEVLPTLEGLLGIMEAGRYDLDSQNRGKTPLAIAYQNAWEKLSKYYNKTDASHSIYAAATLLHPSYRKQYYDDTWTGDSIDWKDQRLAKVKAVWEQQYKAQAPNQEQQQNAKPPSFIQKYVQKRVQIQASEDLFTRFIS